MISFSTSLLSLVSKPKIWSDLKSVLHSALQSTDDVDADDADTDTDDDMQDAESRQLDRLRLFGDIAICKRLLSGATSVADLLSADNNPELLDSAWIKWAWDDVDVDDCKDVEQVLSKLLLLLVFTAEGDEAIDVAFVVDADVDVDEPADAIAAVTEQSTSESSIGMTGSTGGEHCWRYLITIRQ